MGHMWPNTTSGLLTAHIKMTLIKPDRTFGLLKAGVVGRRIYDPSEFRPVDDPHCKWADQWVIWPNQGPILLSAY